MFRSFLAAARDQLARYRLRRRRKRLLYATAKQQKILHDRPAGFSPLLFAYDDLRARGILDFAVDPDADHGDLDPGDVEIVWHWPPDAPDVEADREEVAYRA